MADTSAQYRLRDDGQLDVINRCHQANGQMAEAAGRARQDGPADSPKLEVRFAPAWLSWLPMVRGNYWVIELDADYQLVAVSEPSREYLWVLSRTPTVEAGAYQALLNRLREKGFDLTRLELTAQPGKSDCSTQPTGWTHRRVRGRLAARAVIACLGLLHPARGLVDWLVWVTGARMSRTVQLISQVLRDTLR